MTALTSASRREANIDATRRLNDVHAALMSTGRLIGGRNAIGFDKRAKVHYGAGLGSPDLLYWLRGSAQAFAVEVKTILRDLTYEQRCWHRMFLEVGCLVIVAAYPGDATTALGSIDSFGYERAVYRALERFRQTYGDRDEPPKRRGPRRAKGE